MLVIGMIVSLLLLVICYIALSGDQPKSIDNHIPNKDDPTAPDDHKPKPPPVVDDDKVEPLARMKQVTTKASIDNDYVIINWQKPQVPEGQTLQGYQVLIQGDDG